ncbi:MAG: D-glycero-beta-D-manno-heptose 1-phosphate adenylyltransferase [Candidatus Magnetomorum sp.]|nr:D-glycero-beta-D-manno-heptose 1-phosphate adenylyltransferase [Candidatus Magnetomorum sp.]
MIMKLYLIDDLIPIIQKLKQQRKTVVFTNGCFDILHAGHVQYLQEAKKQGDILVIGLNSDSSVSTIKGPKRPIVNEQHRAFVLAGLSCVDYITIFDESDPLNVIRQLMPHILVKGSDWAECDIVGADIVKARGGQVVRIHLVPDISTTEIIRRILQREYS